MTTTRKYGSWASPISAAAVVEGSRGLSSLAFDDGYLYWVESRPLEGGRSTIMRWGPGGEPEELLPLPWNARTRVHEYGGRCVLVAGGTIWFSNFADQRIYRMNPGSEPEAVTPAEGFRFAAFVLDRVRNRLICVREDHRGDGEPRNTLVALAPDRVTEGEVLFDDGDFVSAPCISPDGSRIAFTSWRHPNMPWDNTSLWSATFDQRGDLAGLTLHNDGTSEAVLDPQWRADNALFAVSDRDNWWQIYRVTGELFSSVSPGVEHAEIGGPDWSIGRHYYQLLDDYSILAQSARAGVESLLLIDPTTSISRELPIASAAIIDFLAVAEQLFLINAPVDSAAKILATDLDCKAPTLVRAASDTRVDTLWIAPFQQVSFPGTGGTRSHGIYLPPTNPQFKGPDGEAPPLIVSVHGGPTAVASPAFKLNHLFWTSRGFAVLDINYRGSTGFGRAYRRSLYGYWGLYDVEDAVAGAAWLARQGLADPERLIIRGGSAGGLTTLSALAFHDTFSAGASYYGVSDIEALAKDTHKFESRYLDQLIGPYPERIDLYRARSPIHHLEGFNAPLLLLQGLDDPIVPPNQSEMIYEALKARGVPAEYLAFEGESHGFRKAENQIRALEAERDFYSRVLGLA